MRTGGAGLVDFIPPYPRPHPRPEICTLRCTAVTALAVPAQDRPSHGGSRGHLLTKLCGRYCLKLSVARQDLPSTRAALRDEHAPRNENHRRSGSPSGPPKAEPTEERNRQGVISYRTESASWLGWASTPTLLVVVRRNLGLAYHWKHGILRGIRAHFSAARATARRATHGIHVARSLCHESFTVHLRRSLRGRNSELRTEHGPKHGQGHRDDGLLQALSEF